MAHLPPTQVLDSLHPSCREVEGRPRRDNYSRKGPANFSSPDSLWMFFGESLSSAKLPYSARLTQSLVPWAPTTGDTLISPPLPTLLCSWVSTSKTLPNLFFPPHLTKTSLPLSSLCFFFSLKYF